MPPDASVEEHEGITQVSPDEAQALRDRGAILVDVREPEEVAQARVPGAIHIPLQAVPTRLQDLPRDRPLVVLCHSGGRSHAAARFLKHQGYDAANLTGGIVAWHRAGHPVEA